MNIFIIGLPGSGKSTLGEKMASLFNHSYFDLDVLIEEQEGMSIPSIFSKAGEAYFREAETRCLVSFIKHNNDYILSTGGGTPCHYENLELMKGTGEVIFLNTPLDLIAKRLEKDTTDRPLVKKADTYLYLKDLFDKRERYYLNAHQVANDEAELKEIISAL